MLVLSGEKQKTCKHLVLVNYSTVYMKPLVSEIQLFQSI